MLDRILSIPDPQERIDESKKVIAKSKVESVNNAPDSVVLGDKQIFESLTPDQQKKWNECVKEAEMRYYAMMEDLGYNPEEFKFCRPCLSYHDEGDQVNIAQQIVKVNRDGIDLSSKYYHYITYNKYHFEDYFEANPASIVGAIIHENIHFSDNNLLFDQAGGPLNTNKSGLDLSGSGITDLTFQVGDEKENSEDENGEKERKGKYFSVKDTTKKIMEKQFDFLLPEELEFLKLVFNQKWDDVFGRLSVNVSSPEVKSARETVDRFSSFMPAENLQSAEEARPFVENLEFSGKSLNLALLMLLSSLTSFKFTNSFNEALGSYFAIKYNGLGFEGQEFLPPEVKKIKDFIDQLPTNLQKSFERALMDAKILAAAEGGGYPVLTRWFFIHLGLRITPLVFMNMDFDRPEIQEKLEELKK